MKDLDDIIFESIILAIISISIVCTVHVFMEDYMFSVGITNPDYSEARPKVIVEAVCVFGILFMYNLLARYRNRSGK